MHKKKYLIFKSNELSKALHIFILINISESKG